MDLIKLREQLIEHEGIRYKPYKCTAGKTTIGVGRNLDDKGISHAEALILLENDISECASDVVAVLGHEMWDRLSDARQRVLVDMRFQLGPGGFRSFRGTLQAVREGRYKDAAAGMLASRWATQTPGRAKALTEMMTEG